MKENLTQYRKEYFDQLNDLVQFVKSIVSNHTVITVVAELLNNKV
jgi:hypothetical protein